MLTIGQYLLQLAAYTAVVTGLLLLAQMLRGGTGLWVAWGAVVALGAAFYFARAGAPTSPGPALVAMVTLAVAGLAAVAVIRVRAVRRGAAQRMLTFVAAVVAFDCAWFATAYAFHVLG